MSSDPLGLQFPGGCFIGFNAMINSKGIEQLLVVVAQAIQQMFTHVTICMSSTGGDPNSAMNGYNVLSSLPITLVTHNTGAVQSAAVTVFLAGKERYSCPGATMFFHQTAAAHDGVRRLTEVYLLGRLQQAKREDQRTAQIIAEKSGSPADRIHEWQNAELTMDNEAALQAGLIHEIRPLVIPKNAWFCQVVA